MRLPSLLVSVFLALTALTALAAAERSFEIAPSLGYRNGGSLNGNSAGAEDVEAGASPTWGLSVGWHVSPDGWLEVLFDRQTLSFEPGASSEARPFDLVVDYLQLGGGYEPPSKGLRPYVTVSFGLTRFGSDPGSVSHSAGLSGSIGGGFKMPIGKKALFRLEARGWGTLASGSAAVVCGPGCAFAFSGSGWWQLGLRAAVAYCPSGAR